MFLLLQNKASKLGRGVSLLWSGINLKLLVNAIFYTNGDKSLPKNIYLFESARSAIAFSLRALGIGVGDRVVVCSFTCDAVTYAVTQIGATIEYVDINEDLTMNQSNVFDALENGAKVVLVQNTFGKLGLPRDVIDHLINRGIIVLIDNSLSCGSMVNSVLLSDFGDLSIESFEVSKAITLGWGGRLKVNNPSIHDIIHKEYDKIKALSIWADFQRIFQLYISVLMRKVNINIGIFLWYFFYGIRLFRKSCQKNYKIEETLKKMGKLTHHLYAYMINFEEYIYKLTNKNYLLLCECAKKNGLNLLGEQGPNEFSVTPRISFLVDANDIAHIKNLANKFEVDCGEWFRECPPQYKITESNIIQTDQAQKYSDGIVNFSCHWTLRESEIFKIMNLFDEIGKYVLNKSKR